MAEPTGADVETYTGGRLLDGDDNTALFLGAALAAARKYCGWHVTPERSDVVTLGGLGQPILMLPTLKLVELEEVVEDGISLNITDLEWSSIGQVRKKHVLTSVWPLRHWWSPHYGAITVTMTHGYDDVPDWNLAVLSLIDQMTLSVGTGGSGNLVEKTVSNVTYRWSDKAAVTALGEVTHLLDKYRLVPMA